MTDVLKEFADSRWLGAADLDGEDVEVTILATSREAVKDRTGGDTTKLCLKLRGVEKPLLLNRTNIKSLAKALGADDTNWIGATAVLYVTETSMGDGIRFRTVKPKATMQKALKAGALDTKLNDEIGF